VREALDMEMYKPVVRDQGFRRAVVTTYDHRCALCGVSEGYNVITSRQIAADPNVPGFLLTLSGRGIIPPSDSALWPGQEYLKWHRREWRLA